MKKKTLRKPIPAQKKLSIALILVLIALVSATAFTAAWFRIANATQVYSLALEVTGGAALKMDLDPHENFDDYKKTLSFEEIAARVQRDQGYAMATTPMQPVTTSDAVTFRLEDGTVKQGATGAYWEFPLHFMGNYDMVVHLTSADSKEGANDGTKITANVPELAESMRVSFTADGETAVFDPGMGDFSKKSGEIRIFGLPNATSMVYNYNSTLFTLKKYTDKTVMVRVWLEGTDEACTNALKGKDFTIYLRFEGTDEEGNRLTDIRDRP